MGNSVTKEEIEAYFDESRKDDVKSVMEGDQLCLAKRLDALVVSNSPAQPPGFADSSVEFESFGVPQEVNVISEPEEALESLLQSAASRLQACPSSTSLRDEELYQCTRLASELKRILEGPISKLRQSAATKPLEDMKREIRKETLRSEPSVDQSMGMTRGAPDVETPLVPRASILETPSVTRVTTAHIPWVLQATSAENTFGDPSAIFDTPSIHSMILERPIVIQTASDDSPPPERVPEPASDESDSTLDDLLKRHEQTMENFNRFRRKMDAIKASCKH